MSSTAQRHTLYLAVNSVLVSRINSLLVGFFYCIISDEICCPYPLKLCIILYLGTIGHSNGAHTETLSG